MSERIRLMSGIHGHGHTCPYCAEFGAGRWWCIEEEPCEKSYIARCLAHWHMPESEKEKRGRERGLRGTITVEGGTATVNIVAGDSPLGTSGNAGIRRRTKSKE